MESAADSSWKGYSLAERDRRWNAVRQRAADAGFDCIFIPLTVDPENLRTSSAGSSRRRPAIQDHPSRLVPAGRPERTPGGQM